LQALTVLARHYPDDIVKIRDVAKEEQLPEKFLEAILRDLKRARFVNSIRGAAGLRPPISALVRIQRNLGIALRAQAPLPEKWA